MANKVHYVSHKATHRLCREILNWCVRNTERADARARSEGAPPRGRGIWGMIEASALARDVRKGEGKRVRTSVWEVFAIDFFHRSN